MKFRVNKKQIIDYIIRYGVLVIFIIMVLFFALQSQSFVKPSNWMNILKHSVPISLISLGLTFSMLVGGLDMSIGAIYSFSAVICSGLIVAGMPIILAIISTIIVGLFFGLFNGFAAVILKIPAFIATLSTMFIIIGLQSLYTHGERIDINSDTYFSFIGRGYLGRFLAFSVIILLLSIGFAYFFTKNIKTGIYIYATGFNLNAAIIAGISTNLIKIIAFIICGGFCALAGIIQASNLSGASASSAGISFILNSVVAVFIGASMFRKGNLSIIGTIIGSLFVAVLTNGLAFLEISHLSIQGIKGLILIIVLILNSIGKKKFKYHIGQMPV